MPPSMRRRRHLAGFQMSSRAARSASRHSALHSGESRASAAGAAALGLLGDGFLIAGLAADLGDGSAFLGWAFAAPRYRCAEL